MFNVPPDQKGPRDIFWRRMVIIAAVVMVVVCVLLLGLYYIYVLVGQ
jgi:hypothetical protein